MHRGGLFLLHLLLLLGLLAAVVRGQQCPVVQLKAKLNRKRVLLGGRARLTVTWRNTGATTADRTVIQVVLPAANGVRLDASKAAAVHGGTPTFTQDGATLRWAFGALAPKKSVKLSINLWVEPCGLPAASAVFAVSAYQLAGQTPTCVVTAPSPTSVAVVAPKSAGWAEKHKATCSPTTTPTAVPTVPVCYNKETLVHLADGTRKAVHLLQKGERVATSTAGGSVSVVAVVEMYNAGNATALFKDMCQLDQGFFIAGTHPVRVGGRWIRPKWQFACTRTMPFASLFGLVLDAGHSVVLHGFEVATFVPGPVGVQLIDIPHKFKWYQAIAAAPGFAEGYVRIDTRELAKLRPADWDGSVYDWLQFEEAVVAPAAGVGSVGAGAASAM